MIRKHNGMITMFAAALIGGWMLAGYASSAEPVTTAAEGLVLKQSEAWTPRAIATPVTEHAADGSVTLAGNGTPTCCGGWQYFFTGIRGGQAYHIRTRVDHQGLAHARESLVAMVLYDRWEPGHTEMGQRPCNYLLPKSAGAGETVLEAVVVPPEGATSLTVRYIFRWSEQGRAHWSVPQVEPTSVPQKKPVKVCVVSLRRRTPAQTKVQPFSQGLGLPADVAQSVDTWASLITAACERKPQLIVTPECVIGGKDFVEGSVAVPGPVTQPFEKIAREHQVHIVLGTKQRDGNTFYNSAVLIGPEGKVLGVYHKVHLATTEGFSGLTPGNSFPVFETGIGRIGCMICMDTTVNESARMLALNGADFICMPIMGDMRADRWSPGSPVFQEDRWKLIMRSRAIDNQLCMVVARNEAQGSCIIDRKGDILAWNEGNEEIIDATLPAEDGYRAWEGTDFREVTYMLRRPQLYGAYTDESNLKPLHRSDVPPASLKESKP